MGANNSITQESSLFKTYKPEEWIANDSSNCKNQLWWNKRTNQHFEVYPLSKNSTIEDLEKYELRYLHSYYLVKVFDVIRLTDSDMIAKPPHEHNFLLI